MVKIKEWHRPILFAGISLATAAGALLYLYGLHTPRQDLQALEKSLGIKTLVLESKQRRPILEVEVKPSLSRCFLGDLDAIKMEAKHTKSRKLLLSIENLTSFKTVFRKKISLNKIEKGSRFKIKLKKSTKPQQWGFFLCQTDKKNICHDKLAADINQVFRHFFRETGRLEEYANRSKIYYFQPSIVQGNKLKVITEPINATVFYPNFGMYLTQFLGSRNSVNDLINRMRDIDEAVNSMPLEITDKGSVAMLLPKIHPECDVMDKIKKLYQSDGVSIGTDVLSR